MDEPDLRSLGVELLFGRCTDETTRYFRKQRHDDRFCYELLCRGVIQKDLLARHYFNSAYEYLISKWIREIMPEIDESEIKLQISETTDYFWKTYTAKKLDHRSLPEALAFLRICAKQYTKRYLRRKNREVPLDKLLKKPIGWQPDPDEIPVEEKIWSIVEEHCKDQRDRIVVHASFFEGLKPQDIYARYPGVFESVQEVYTIKRNLLDRLRRDPRINRFRG